MIKYRIVYEYGLYYAQQKQWFWWTSVNYPTSGFHTQERAHEAIVSHNKMFGKGSNTKTVVWIGEME